MLGEWVACYVITSGQAGRAESNMRDMDGSRANIRWRRCILLRYSSGDSGPVVSWQETCCHRSHRSLRVQLGDRPCRIWRTQRGAFIPVRSDRSQPDDLSSLTIASSMPRKQIPTRESRLMEFSSLYSFSKLVNHATDSWASCSQSNSLYIRAQEETRCRRTYRRPPHHSGVLTDNPFFPGV